MERPDTSQATVQYILYESDAVEISFSDGGRLQLSPCASTFVYQLTTPLSSQHHPQLTANDGFQQRTQFATSAFRLKVRDALEFRNRFAIKPFLCRELLEPEHIVRYKADIFDVSWPSELNDASFLVFGDGSVQLSCLQCSGSQSASVWLAPTQRTFTVRFLAKLGRNQFQRSTSSIHSNVSDDKVHIQEDKTRRRSDSPTTRRSNSVTGIPSHHMSNSPLSSSPLLHSSRSPSSNISGNSHNSPSGNFTRNGTDSVMTDGKSCDAEVAEIFGQTSLEYAWVTQHHSVAFHPECWSHPVKLLKEFCQSTDYRERLARCASGNLEDTCLGNTGLIVAGNSDSLVRHSELPTSMALRCASPHLHKWNPSISDDFCDYFHDRVKIICTSGVVYRLLWHREPKAVEIYVQDGSVIRSVGQSGHHFTHYVFSLRSQQIEERTYSSLSPPPLSTDLPYSVSRLITMASRLLELMSSKCLDLSTRDQPVCWKNETRSTSLQPVLTTRVVEERFVDGVGRFTAFSDGSVRIVFDDRTCLDLHGLQWEQHVLKGLSSDDSSGCIAGPKSIPDKTVCKLLLPNGHYQHVDVQHPQSPYERYVNMAMEWVMWVNTPLSQRETFYDSRLYEPKQLAEMELKKIRCFSYILDRVLGNSNATGDSSSSSPATRTPSAENHLQSQSAGNQSRLTPTSVPPLSTATRSTSDIVIGARSVAEQALTRNAALLRDLDSYLATAPSGQHKTA